MPYKIIGIGRSRERPACLVHYSPSSLYSVQLYLVWSQKLHQITWKNALSYPCGSTEYKKCENAKSRTCTSTQFSFSFLSFLFTLDFFFRLFSASLSRALFLLSLSLSLFLSLYLSPAFSFTHTDSFFLKKTSARAHALSFSRANLIECTCSADAK